MRFNFVLLAMLCCSNVHAAAVDCPSLAKSFQSASSKMNALLLAQVRGCVDPKAWPTSSSGPASAPLNDKGALRLDQGAECTRLADAFASTGPAPLSEAERSALKACIDEAITTISSKPRPGTTAHMPTPAKRFDDIV